jgi:hypothetical protein
MKATIATRSPAARGSLLLETMMALKVGQAVKQHIKLRKRNAGFAEAEMVEDLVLLLGTGGECLDDLAMLAPGLPRTQASGPDRPQSVGTR